MNRTTNNLLISNRTVMNSKSKFRFNFRKVLLSVYAVWVLCSLFLAATHSHKYALYFTDLPQYLKDVPPFVLSLLYLDLFVPVIALGIFCALCILFFVIWSTYKK